MNIITILILLLLVNIVSTTLIGVLWKRYHSVIQGTREWFLGFLSADIAIVLYMFQGYSTEFLWIPIIISSFLQVLTSFYFMHGTALFMRRDSNKWVRHSVLFLFLFNFIAFYAIHNSEHHRALTSAISLALVFFHVAYIVKKGKHSQRAGILFWGCIILGLSHLLRIYTAYSCLSVEATCLLEAQLKIMYPLLVSIVGVIVTTVGLFDLISQTLYAEKTEYLDELESYKITLLKVLDDRTEELVATTKRASTGDLAAGLIHDIMSLLNNISTNIQALQLGYKNLQNEKSNKEIPEDDVEALLQNIPQTSQIIGKNVRRIEHLCKDLTNYAQPEESDEEAVFDIRDAVTTSCTLLSKTIADATHHFTMTLPDKSIHVQGNIYRMEQVIINLIRNSCEALSSKENSITIEVSEEFSTVAIKIIDEGTGIPEEVVSHITNPYVTFKENGNGLGLFIAQNIISSMGGVIKFKTLQSGTMVSIHLPVYLELP